MAARSVLLVVILALALSTTAAAQGPPASQWDSAPAPEAGGGAHDGGRSAVLFGLGVLALAGAGGLALLAVRARAIAPMAGGDLPRDDATPARFAAAAAAAEALPAQRDCWHPRPVAGPPPRPAFGPGAAAAPPAAPPPPPPPG